MSSKRGRLDRLEDRAEARRKEVAERVPLSDAAACLRDMLGIVAEEAGEATADRVAVRTVPLLEVLAVRAGVRL